MRHYKTTVAAGGQLFTAVIIPDTLIATAANVNQMVNTQMDRGRPQVTDSMQWATFMRGAHVHGLNGLAVSPNLTRS